MGQKSIKVLIITNYKNITFLSLDLETLNLLKIKTISKVNLTEGYKLFNKPVIPVDLWEVAVIQIGL